MSGTSRAERAHWIGEEPQRLRARYTALASAPETEGPVQLMRRRRLTVLDRPRPWPDPDGDSTSDSTSESDGEWFGEFDLRLQAVPGDIVARTPSGHFALTWDGRVWKLDAPRPWHVPVPPGASGSTAVLRLSGSRDETELAVIRDDGALLLADLLLGPRDEADLAVIQDDGALLLADSVDSLTFVETCLGGEWAVEVFIGDDDGYALTREGSIWAWGYALYLPGVPSEEGDWEDWTPPVQVTELAGGRAAPPFTALAVEPKVGICAMDAQGRLYACGKGLFVDEAGRSWELLVELPPAPAPVRQLFTFHQGSAAAQFVTSAASSQRFKVLRRRAGVNDALRALLADGTVWGLLSQARLPNVHGAAHIRSIDKCLFTSDARPISCT